MKTLLVLDDELAVLKLLGSVLKKQYLVIEATTAEQAWSLFIEHRHTIDLLVADVTLHTSSGIRVAMQLRSLVPGLPVVLTSGYPVNSWSDRDDADRKLLGSELVAILQKPFLVGTLLTAIQNFIGHPQAELERNAMA